MSFPLIGFYKNIVFTKKNKAYAIYSFSGLTYSFFSKDHKAATVAYLEEILTGFKGKGAIALIWEELSMDWVAYKNRNSGDVSGILAIKAEEHAKAVEREISSGASQLNRYILLELPISSDIGDLEELWTHMRDVATRAFLTLKPAEMPLRYKKAAKEAEEIIFAQMNKHKFKRITFKDLDFLIRKNVLKTEALPQPLPDRESGFFNPAAIAAFSDGVLIDESINYVKITDTHGREHYQTFLHFVDLPQTVSPLGENVFSVNEFHYTFDSIIHFEIFTSHEAKNILEDKKRLLKGQRIEANQANHETSINEQTGLEMSSVLQSKLDSGKTLAKMAITISLAHKDNKELKARASQVMSHFLQMNYRVVRPLSLQYDSLMSFIPGAEPITPMIACDPAYIASLGPHFSVELGDPDGFHIGRSGQIPVKYKPGRAAKELNKTNAVLITGALGAGKSVVAKLLAFLTLLANGYVLAIDPKEEYAPFIELLSERFGEEIVNRLVNTVDLSPRGGIALNPFTFSSVDINAYTIAQSYLSLALNATGKESRIIAISQALDKLFKMNIEHRNMYTYMDCLDQISKEHPREKIREEALQALDLIQAMEHTDIGSMSFGKQNEVFFKDQVRMLIINIKEIPRPKADVKPSEYTEAERQGIALLYLVAAISREVAFALPRELPKNIIFDEAWVIASLSEGERLLEEIIRIGRSYNLIPVIISQNNSDVDRPVFVNNTSQVFCFRTQSAEETKTGLRILGADPEVVSANTFASLESGQCLFRDNMGRIGWLKVELLPEYLEKVFDSKP